MSKYTIYTNCSQVKSIQRQQVDKKEAPAFIKDQLLPLFKKPLLKYTMLTVPLFMVQQYSFIFIILSD